MAGQPIKLKSTLSSSAARLIRFVNIAICCVFAATQHAQCAAAARYKVDVIAITPKAAANSGCEPSLSVNFIRASIAAVKRGGKMRQPARRRLTPDRPQIA